MGPSAASTAPLPSAVALSSDRPSTTIPRAADPAGVPVAPEQSPIVRRSPVIYPVLLLAALLLAWLFRAIYRLPDIYDCH